MMPHAFAVALSLVLMTAPATGQTAPGQPDDPRPAAIASALKLQGVSPGAEAKIVKDVYRIESVGVRVRDGEYIITIRTKLIRSTD